MTTTDEDAAYLRGKVALVTGASRGIGRAIALKLGALGAAVALAARDEVALADVSRSMPPAAGRASRHVFDLGEAAAADELVGQVVDTHGRIDIVVNNAGGSVPGSLTELDDFVWDEAFGLKLFGGMRVARAAWVALADARGSLINIAGAAGWSCEVRGIIAATQCGGYYAMTKSIAALGLSAGVQVNAVNPGPVWTDRLKARLPQLGIDASRPEDEILAELAGKFGLRRIARPEDIANLVGFVLSPSGGVFHGALINFDGGVAKGL